ncbi:MAG: radical SAM protein [Betaproteobacteria bacterium]|nr:radical SAM protein [Betaproteobacteria bacterium]
MRFSQRSPGARTIPITPSFTPKPLYHSKDDPVPLPPVTLAEDASFEVVVKIQETCNLDCDYCYMYNVGNELYKQVPGTAPADLFVAVADFVVHEFKERNPKYASIILHGGEPMLIPPRRFDERMTKLTERLRLALKPEQLSRIRFQMQSNATLVSDAWLEQIRKWKIFLGISLDGPQAVHDGRRKQRRGGGSHERVMEGIRRVQNAIGEGKLPQAGLGLLCVVTPEADGAEVYRYFRREVKVKGFDFLLPFHNWVQHREEVVAGTGRFLLGAFREWVQEADRVNVRVFRELVTSLLRQLPRHNPNDIQKLSHFIAIVESDGTFMPEESLRSTYPLRYGNYSIYQHRIADLLKEPLFHAAAWANGLVSSECNDCALVEHCASGSRLTRIGMRYAGSEHALRKSVYCPTLIDLFVEASAFLKKAHCVPLWAEDDELSLALRQYTT